MGSIRSSIELQDNFTNILMNVINAVNISVSTMEQMQSVMNEPIDTAAIQGIRDQLNQATLAAQELDAAMQNVDTPSPEIAPPLPAPVEVPVMWQSNNLDVFTNSGIERFEMEVQNTNDMLNTLNQTQAQIAARAAQTNIFPPNMVTDMNGMQNRLQAIQERIQAIENNPVNMGTDAANAELEQLRAQLNQAVQEQELMNRAVEDMDIQAANEAYLRLSQIIGGTERHIRDNVDEQGRFRREIEESTDSAADLKNMIAGAVGAFAGMAGLKKAKGWIEDCTAAFNTQLNAETQLISVLANMLDEEYVAQFEVDAAADTTAVIDEINAIQAGVDEIVVPVTAETRALTAAYDQITAKASEIQGRGIYGDEVMIAAAAEFSTYFTDTDAIEMMMDTLSNYAMGMTGGGAIDSTGMVDYATNLGKIMSGSYDAMTKKGFEFSDAQKAIIEGEATREQIVAALGEEYVDMSEDMQAAAAITQVIDEAWAGLYESMSNTPEGKIIQLNNAWGDMKEVVGEQLYPYILLFVSVIEDNWPTIEQIVQGITIGLEYMLGFMSWLAEGAFNFARVVIDNWEQIVPVVSIVVTAFTILAAVLLTYKVAIGVATAAQALFNAALLGCPIVWIVVLVIALVAAVYKIVDAVNEATGTTISATGIIAGVIASWVAFVINYFIMIYNYIASLVEWFANVWTHPVYSTKKLFVSLANLILDFCIAATEGFDEVATNLANAFISGANLAVSGINWIIDALNLIPGVNIDNVGELDKVASITSSMRNVKEDLAEWLGPEPEDYTSVRNLDYISIGDAWNAGYSFGEGIDESISNFDPSSLFGVSDIPSAEDYVSALTAGGIGCSIDDIAGNTGAIADSMDITGEELKYLRDIAEQEAINRFTTAEINIEQTNHNTIKNGMDLDGVMSGMTDMVYEAIDISTEGVHN